MLKQVGSDNIVEMEMNNNGKKTRVAFTQYQERD